MDYDARQRHIEERELREKQRQEDQYRDDQKKWDQDYERKTERYLRFMADADKLFTQVAIAGIAFQITIASAFKAGRGLIATTFISLSILCFVLVIVSSNRMLRQRAHETVKGHERGTPNLKSAEAWFHGWFYAGLTFFLFAALTMIWGTRGDLPKVRVESLNVPF